MAVADPFRAVVDWSGTAPVVALHGDLDAATAPMFERAVSEVFDRLESIEQLVLDLGDLAFIDSSGLNVLVAAANRMRRGSASIVAVNASPSARRLFSISGIDRVIDVRDVG